MESVVNSFLRFPETYGIIGPFFGPHFRWIGCEVVEVESLPVKDSSNEDF